MQSHFQVDRRTDGSASVVTLSGELDVASAGSLEQALSEVSDHQHLIIDLRQLDFIDSTGLSVLVAANQRALDSGQRLGIVNGGTQVQRLLTLTGLTERLQVADTLEQLLDGA